ncbi:MAG: MauE/DoxX family redox-associated membrane protein [Gemmatimonadota bacterium]
MTRPATRTVTRWIFGVLLCYAGTNHFLHPDGFVHIMPDYLPWHLELVYLSGVAECGLGLMLLVKRLARVASWGIIALLIAVFPANINMAVHPEIYPQAPVWALWLRLPLQGLLIWWVYQYTKPGHRKHRHRNHA